MVDEFLNRSDASHLLFIDSDIHFQPEDVIAMLALDKDVIGGPYPKKAIKWKSIKTAITKNPDIDLGNQKLGILQGTCGMGMYPFEIDFQS